MAREKPDPILLFMRYRRLIGQAMRGVIGVVEKNGAPRLGEEYGATIKRLERDRRAIESALDAFLGPGVVTLPSE